MGPSDRISVGDNRPMHVSKRALLETRVGDYALIEVRSDGDFQFADNPGVIARSPRQEKSDPCFAKGAKHRPRGGGYRSRGCASHSCSYFLLLFYKVIENCITVICVNGRDLLPVSDDHKIQVRMAGRKRTRAVRVYGVGARNIHRQDLATKAHSLRGGEVSVSFKRH